MKYNLSQIMKKAWELFRKGKVTFAEALHRAWLSAKAVTINQKRIEDAKAAAGVEEETNTWSEWKMFFVKYFSLKKASEFPFFSKGFSLPSAGIMHPCA